MEIFNHYFIEIIAGITIFFITIIYILVKQNTKSKKNIQEIVEDTFEDKETQQENLNKEIQEEIVEKKVQKTTRTNRKKREVPPHLKIRKDDFKIFKGTRILIAEDNLINQKVITSLLDGSGIDITMASDGEIALDILKSDTHFSLILMDAHMPNIDGFKATQIIRDTPQYEHIPVIALSGDTATDDINHMYSVGMEAQLEKPLKMNALYDIIYAYTSGDESQHSSISTKKEILNFDIEAGLEICGGDKAFHIEILNDFLSKYENSAINLQQYISNKNALSADKMLLDISGVAANIGANHLHDLAIQLKENIANPEDLEYVSNVKEYKRALKEVCDSIYNYQKN